MYRRKHSLQFSNRKFYRIGRTLPVFKIEFNYFQNYLM